LGFAGSNEPGIGYNFNANGITSPQAAPETAKESFAMLLIDDHYLDVYGISLVAGTNFTRALCEKAGRAAIR
jgi:putative ABC transport system permease protein